MSRTVVRASLPLRARAPFLIAVTTALALAACGGDEPAQTAAPAAGPAATAPAAATPAAPPVAPAPDIAKLPVPELLKKASVAMNEERLITPPGDNAIEYYLAVTAQEPNNVQATQALVDLFPLVASIAERAIAQRDAVEAQRIVVMLERASPGSYTVSTIKTKLEQLNASILRDEERKLAAEAAAQQAATQAAAQAAAREAEPEPEPARPAPTPTPPPPTQVAAVTPPPAAAPAPVPAAPAAETRDAQILRSVQPGYPPDAVRKRQEGWVELEFTVGADGRVKNVSVARAQPTRVFDREAIRAMQQWTFRPALNDGQPVETQRRQRMEFKLGG